MNLITLKRNLLRYVQWMKCSMICYINYKNILFIMKRSKLILAELRVIIAGSRNFDDFQNSRIPAIVF